MMAPFMRRTWNPRGETPLLRHCGGTHRKRGAKGIQARPTPGRPPKLDRRQRMRLERLLLKGAWSAGYESDLWTCPRIAELIAEQFGVRYHPDHIGRLLRSLGWSPQRPQRRAAERNEQRIQGWVREDWPRIKKKPRGGTPGSRSSTRVA